ncbi:rod shape-determining protein MreC [Amphibiibacter pelophylacis]|uniref:Rod shape-determining protein MreC n=1 Tax=Amphibiibacter pelophylacis TaxID=1799477 RepID=A0ACC6P5C8_9BURK
MDTLHSSPPPFFRRGASPLSKLIFFIACSLALMVADLRFGVMQPLRSLVATTILPVQLALKKPVDIWSNSTEYVQGLNRVVSEESQLRTELARMAEQSNRMEQILRENDRLRALLELRPNLPITSRAAEVMYDAPDLFSHRLVIDKGQLQGVKIGSPVITESGLIGQVSQVYPLTSEVTLEVDVSATTPVVNARTQQRAVLYGTGDLARLDLRYLPSNADVQVGDPWVTGGLDGVFPAGLKVGTVISIDRRENAGFARIVVKPYANLDGVRHVLVLDPRQPLINAPAVQPPPPGAHSVAQDVLMGRPGTPGSATSIDQP